MQLNNLKLAGFRCFNSAQFSFRRSPILIQGKNGVGKTALLEAIHYLSFFRSFRTHASQELVHFDSPTFFIQATFAEKADDILENRLSVCFKDKKKIVKLNNKIVKSFKDLTGIFRVISLTESDLVLVQDGPESRRTFIDQHVFLGDRDYIMILRRYRSILNNRNALLRNYDLNLDMYELWSKQLWDISCKIKKIRIAHLQHLEQCVQYLCQKYYPSITINFQYKDKASYTDSFEGFNKKLSSLKINEMKFQRSLFGTHLDDIEISFCKHHSRFYASRGQQKLIILLLKIAQIQILTESKGGVILLLDDFTTDLDDNRVRELIPLLCSLNCQLIIATAQHNSILHDAMKRRNPQYIQLG